MKLYLILTSLIILSSTAHAREVEAPFGLTWGATKSSLESKGVTFNKCTPNGILAICETRKTIKPISFGETYVLLFHPKLGLRKVMMLSNDISDDITGRKGKELYSKIQSALSKKYGAPNNYEYTGRKVYKEFDEFYQCLKYSGCGQWLSLWDSKEGGAVVLEVKGSSRGKGFLKLTYESKSWSGIVDAIQNRTNTDDIDSL